jgi:hypothetical protein
MCLRKNTRWSIAVLLLVVLAAVHASAATSGVSGTTESATLARIETGTVATSPHGMATPMAAFVAFLAGYIVADLVHHLGTFDALRAPIGADDRLFDF